MKKIMKNKKGLEKIIEILLWVLLSAVLVAAVYFLLKLLTGT